MQSIDKPRGDLRTYDDRVCMISFSGRLLDARISGISKVYTHLSVAVEVHEVGLKAQAQTKARAQSTAYQKAHLKAKL